MWVPESCLPPFLRNFSYHSRSNHSALIRCSRCHMKSQLVIFGGDSRNLQFLLLNGVHGMLVAECIRRHIDRLDDKVPLDWAVFLVFTISFHHGGMIFLMGVWQLFLVSRNQTTLEFFKVSSCIKHQVFTNTVGSTSRSNQNQDFARIFSAVEYIEWIPSTIRCFLDPQGITTHKRHIAQNLREVFGNAWLPALIPLYGSIRGRHSDRSE